MPNKTLVDTLKFYGATTLAAVLGPIGPWLEPYLKLKLITDYFQPWVNSAASAVAALAFLVAFGYLRKTGREKLKRTGMVFLVLFAVGFATCLWLKFALGTVWAPGRMGMVTAWFGWVIAYIMLFVSLAVTLCIAAFLAE
jgi:hypothetical protein